MADRDLQWTAARRASSVLAVAVWCARAALPTALALACAAAIVTATPNGGLGVEGQLGSVVLLSRGGAHGWTLSVVFDDGLKVRLDLWDYFGYGCPTKTELVTWRASSWRRGRATPGQTPSAWLGFRWKPSNPRWRGNRGPTRTPSGGEWDSLDTRMPAWVAAALASIWPAVWVYRPCRAVVRYRRGACVYCGYELRTRSLRCPECGRRRLRLRQALARAARTRGNVARCLTR